MTALNGSFLSLSYRSAMKKKSTRAAYTRNAAFLEKPVSFPASREHS
ncbi:MAG: hypothetical protein ACTSXO_13405 [Candidatus Heimdallarchaeota archaeon]